MTGIMKKTSFSCMAVAAVCVAVGCGGDSDAVDAGAIDAAAFPGAVRPTKRSEMLPVVNPSTGAMIIFGGNNGPVVNQIPSAAYLGDTWVLDPVTGWSELTGTGPSARGRHTAVLDPNGNRMLVFGGRWRETGTTGNYTLYNDLWALDLAAGTWTQLNDGSGTAPSPRYYPASAYDAATDTLYVFGGGTNANPLSITKATDVWAYDASGWRVVTTSGTPPSSRLFFGSAHDTVRNNLVVFGGQIGNFSSLAYNDLFSLDLDTGVWSELDSGTGPSTRMHAHLTHDATRDRYLLFGGHTDIGDANDLWAFDPTGGGWSTIYAGDTFTGAGLGCLGDSSEVPANYVDQDLSAPERRHRGLFALVNDSLWLFGGMHAECSDHLDDTWRFDLASNTWTELIEARTGESCARRNDDCTCLCL